MSTCTNADSDDNPELDAIVVGVSGKNDIVMIDDEDDKASNGVRVGAGVEKELAAEAITVWSCSTNAFSLFIAVVNIEVAALKDPHLIFVNIVLISSGVPSFFSISLVLLASWIIALC